MTKATLLLLFLIGPLVLLLFSISIPAAEKTTVTVSEEDKLKEIRKLKIVIEPLTSETMKAGFTEKNLEDQALATLRSKLPQVEINPQATHSLYLWISLMEVRSAGVVTGWVGLLELEIIRPVEILLGADMMGDPIRERMQTWATVWERGRLLYGPPGTEISRVRRDLDQLLSTFIAAYYKGNP